MHRVQDVPTHQCRSKHEGNEDLPGHDVGGLSDLGEAEHHPGQARNQQEDADEVEAPGRAEVGRGVPLDQAPRQHGGDGPDRDVDEEQGPPAGAVQNQTAQYRAEDRTEGQDDTHQTHDASGAGGSGSAGQQDQHQWIDDARTDTLQNPEDHKAREVPGQRRGERRQQEHGQSDEPHPAGPESTHRPCGDRDRHDEGQEVTGRDPPDGGQARLERTAERLHGDGDHRAVEDGHDAAQQDGHDHHAEFRVEGCVGPSHRGAPPSRFI
nr:hypothetical protein [Pseudonocardia sp. HH130629-09]